MERLRPCYNAGMLRPRAHLPALLVSLVAGCGACDEGDRVVPFGRGDVVAASDDQADEPLGPFEPRQGQTLAAGTSRVAVEGAPLEAAQGALRALLTLDADRDGDRDALAVTTTTGGAVAIAFARREASAFGELAELAEVTPAREGCDLAEASLRTLSHRLAVATIERACPDGPERALAIVSIEEQPRVKERIVLLPAEGRTPGRVSIALRTSEEDGDGFDDVVLDVSIQRAGKGSPLKLALTWLDRPSGLARDAAEPGKTLADLADAARDKLGDDPAGALRLASTAHTVHGVLCREGTPPRLTFGGSPGLPCERSAAAARAVAVMAAAQVAQGELFAALETGAELDEPHLAASKADRRLLARAWSAVPTPPGLRWRKLGPHEPPTSPPVRLSALAPLEDEELLLRGESPQQADLMEGALAPAAPRGDDLGDWRVLDPSRKFVVTDVHRSCEGRRLSIVRSSDVVAGVVAGRPVSEPLLEALAPPANARCPGKVPAAAREDDGGWRVLGWAPQGVVAVRGAAVRIVPLTVDAEPAGEPTEIAERTPLPAPLPPGAATPGGDAYVVATDHGVLLHDVLRGETRLLRPEGWDRAQGKAHDAAVSPDASRAAVMRGKDVYVLEGLDAS